MTTNIPQPPPSPQPDLATMLQRAVTHLAALVAAKPESEKLLAEMVRLCGGALRAGGAGVWVTENADRPELILEFHLAAVQLLANGKGNGGGGGAITGGLVGVGRGGGGGKRGIVPGALWGRGGGGGGGGRGDPERLG
ncbi:MAG: hypothetical protein FWD61_15200, partial [Phycisphaerales bacterium]|nr:hypothetical protein [Phycisphaerales bacterium]